MPADAITYPLGPPTVSGTTYTVDFLLNNPTRITRIINDLVESNYFLDRVFSSGGEVEGGALLYDQATALDHYTDRDVERIEPGTEAPIVTGARVAPLVAQVEKFGGKFPVNKEARRRNNISRVTNHTRRLANTIVRKMHQRGLSELAAAVTANSRTASASSWADAMALTNQTQAPNLLPAVDLAAATKDSETNELGYVYDTLIVHPNEAMALRVVYGDRLTQVLSDQGIDDLIVTPRKTAGSAYVLAGGQVGELRLEEPLRTTVADEETSAPSMVERTWVQSLVNPVMAVTDPFAIIELTGLAA